MLAIGRALALAFAWGVRLVGLWIMASTAATPSKADKPFLYFAALAMIGISFTVPEDLKRWRARPRREDDDE